MLESTVGFTNGHSQGLCTFPIDYITVSKRTFQHFIINQITLRVSWEIQLLNKYFKFILSDSVPEVTSSKFYIIKNVSKAVFKINIMNHGSISVIDGA